MGALSFARRSKHLVFVAHKRGRRRARRAKFDLATVAFRDAERIRPYAYRPQRYADTFLARDVSPRGESQFPHRAFVVWTGDNELTPRRATNLKLIEQRIGLPVVLVTPTNLKDWLVPGHPLHAAYEHLSLIHRSDYLRGYLMHHHGGAYVDVKQPLGSWEKTYQQMAADPEAWVTSYSSSHANWIGKLEGRIGLDILVRYRLMFGKGGFMMRSQTPLTSEWMDEVHRRLNEAAEVLAESGGGGVYGADGYPFGWTDLLGRVLDPLTLKYQAHVRYDEGMLLDFTDYR